MQQVQTDYVTEKFYIPLMAGAVPVYLGAPNIEDFAPDPHSYIDVQAFESPEALALKLLHLAADPLEFAQMHAWRERPWRAGCAGKRWRALVSASVRMPRLLAGRLLAGLWKALARARVCVCPALRMPRLLAGLDFHSPASRARITKTCLCPRLAGGGKGKGPGPPSTQLTDTNAVYRVLAHRVVGSQPRPHLQ